MLNNADKEVYFETGEFYFVEDKYSYRIKIKDEWHS